MRCQPCSLPLADWRGTGFLAFLELFQKVREPVRDLVGNEIVIILLKFAADFRIRPQRFGAAPRLLLAAGRGRYIWLHAYVSSPGLSTHSTSGLFPFARAANARMVGFNVC